MKTFHRYVIAAVLLLSVMATIFPSRSTRAADQGTKTVTVHKLLLDNGDFGLDEFTTPEGYDGSQTIDQFNLLLQGSGRDSVWEIGDVYFAWQNASNEWIDQTGRVVASVDEAYGMLTRPTGAIFDTSQLPAGDYKIVEVYEKSTYAGQGKELLTKGRGVPVEVTLPMFKADGTTIENAHAYPKNTAAGPTISKSHNVPRRRWVDPTHPHPGYMETAEMHLTLGSPVDFSIAVTIPSGTKYQHLSFTDTMTEGLTLIKNRFNPKVYIATRLAEGIPQFEEGVDKDYTVEYPSDQSFQLTFTQKGLDKLQQAKSWMNNDTKLFTIRYTAYVNASAYQRTSQDNKVIMHYGNNPDVIQDKEASTDVTPNRMKYVKMDGRTNERLALAQFTVRTRAKDPTDGVEKDFYLSWAPITEFGNRAEEEGKIARLTEKQSLFHAALDAYNALSKTQKEDLAEKKKVLDAKKAFDDAFAKAHVKYVWDSEKSNANLLRLTSNDKGQFNILGFWSVTEVIVAMSVIDFIEVKGAYLEEVEAPVGYSVLPDPIEMKVLSTVDPSHSTGFSTTLPRVIYDDERPEIGDAGRINNVKISIPQTGGIGSLIFVGLGAVFTGVAIYYLRNRKENEDA